MCMPANDKTIPSLIKWTGSKRKQAPLIAREAKSYNRYFEPFLGGGALLFLFAHEGAVASDIYEPLISLWKLIQSKPEEVISDYTEKWNTLNVEYKELQLNHIKNADGLPKVFYDCRSRFNKTHNPLDLNFIMRTCVNGIVRFNGEGEFNNSFHLSRQGMKPEMFAKNVRIWHERIKGVDFECQSYEETLAQAKEGDFVYFDPPYADSHNRYIKDLDLQNFFTELDKLNSKNISWALSFDGSRAGTNYFSDMPKELYKRKLSLSNGNSAVSKILNSKQEEVTESLYLNYN